MQYNCHVKNCNLVRLCDKIIYVCVWCSGMQDLFVGRDMQMCIWSLWTRYGCVVGVFLVCVRTRHCIPCELCLWTGCAYALSVLLTAFVLRSIVFENVLTPSHGWYGHFTLWVLCLRTGYAHRLPVWHGFLHIEFYILYPVPFKLWGTRPKCGHTTCALPSPLPCW